jgi:hypothetical protein
LFGVANVQRVLRGGVKKCDVISRLTLAQREGFFSIIHPRHSALFLTLVVSREVDGCSMPSVGGQCDVVKCGDFVSGHFADHIVRTTKCKSEQVALIKVFCTDETWRAWGRSGARGQVENREKVWTERGAAA